MSYPARGPNRKVGDRRQSECGQAPTWMRRSLRAVSEAPCVTDL
jgi:hypothetical protein